ncbi:Basic-leucine zipper domain, partial [Globisporangium splendens]
MNMSPINYEALRAASPTPNIKVEAVLQRQQQQRGRRKRVAIELPADVELDNMDPKEVKKIKNRIAAARLRERSQQQIRELEAMVQFYKSRAEYLQGVAASCAHCSCFTQPQPFVSSHFEHHASSDAGSPCKSPASSTEDELSDSLGLTLDAFDCSLFEDFLTMAE